MLIVLISTRIKQPAGQIAAAPEKEKLIDWTDSSDRKWLVNHLHWAVHNDREVTIRGEPSQTIL